MSIRLSDDSHEALGVPGVSQGQERSQLYWSLWMAGDWDEKTREMGDLTKSWGSYGGWALLCACQETICHSTISIAVKKKNGGGHFYLAYSSWSQPITEEVGAGTQVTAEPETKRKAATGFCSMPCSVCLLQSRAICLGVAPCTVGCAFSQQPLLKNISPQTCQQASLLDTNPQMRLPPSRWL